MPEPSPVPIGLRLNQAARAVGRAFDEALAQAGGSLPVWLLLLNLKVRRPGTQRELAAAVGIREATLTHHLNAMDAEDLIRRTRDAANRRVQVVTLTEKGDAAFLRLRAAAIDFDAKLSTGLDSTDVATLATLLTRLSANVAAPAEAGPPWPSLARPGPPWPGLALPGPAWPAPISWTAPATGGGQTTATASASQITGMPAPGCRRRFAPEPGNFWHPERR